MTPSELDLRVRQLHTSLDSMATEDLSSVVTHSGVANDRFYMSVDFSEGLADADLWNAVDLLLANIGRIRDHLNVWCKQRGRTFAWKAFIQPGTSVALIHDLWNGQKHPGREHGPRSGYWPTLAQMNRSMRLTTGPGPSSAVMTLGRDGKPMVLTSGGGKAELVIDGDILNADGVKVAGFLETCEAALTAWETALAAEGVTVPPRRLSPHVRCEGGD
jgi:hypothetical protein